MEKESPQLEAVQVFEVERLEPDKLLHELGKRLPSVSRP